MITDVAPSGHTSWEALASSLARFVRLLAATLISATVFGSAASAEDTLDRLLALLAERLDISRDVAEAKWNSGAPIADPEREAKVVAGARDQAAATGADPQDVAELVNAQIEASKMLQEQLHSGWRNAGQGPFSDAPSLTVDIRPKLDRIGEALAAAFATVKPTLPGHCAQLEARARSMLANVDAAIRDQSIAPLRIWAECKS